LKSKNSTINQQKKKRKEKKRVFVQSQINYFVAFRNDKRREKKRKKKHSFVSKIFFLLSLILSHWRLL